MDSGSSSRGAMAIATSVWSAPPLVLVTRLSGVATEEDVARWASSLRRALDEASPGAKFGVVADLHGYEPASIGAHRAMRVVLPTALTECGFRTSLLDIAAAQSPPSPVRRRARCTAVAHVHHDAAKMGTYDARWGRPEERFFASFDPALSWVTTRAGRAPR